MATYKDLAEADAFNRRRLVTAFVCGAPGGREVATARPGRTVTGGLLLAALMVSAAVVIRMLSPSVPPGWADPPGLPGRTSCGPVATATCDVS